MFGANTAFVLGPLMFRALLIFTTMVFAATAFAEEPAPETVDHDRAPYAPDRVYLTFSARHLNIDPTNFGRAQWNEANPGVILTWEDRGLLGEDFSLGAVINSYDDPAIFASIGKLWDLGDSDWRLGYVLGVANYGQNARLIGSQIRSSDWIVIGGAQIEYRNLFFQLQPAGTQPGGGYGAVLVTGLTFPLGG